MKLTEKDKAYLRSLGNTERDINQIEYAANRTKYSGNGGRVIYTEEAIKILGRKTWLSGLSRSAFHMTAVRYREGKKEGERIYFDSYAMLD